VPEASGHGSSGTFGKNMKTDPAAPYFPFYMIGLVSIGLASWLWIKTRSKPANKKKWFDVSAIVTGIYVGVFMSFILGLWDQFYLIPFPLLACVFIIYLNMRFTFFCDSCGKRSFSQSWLSRVFHCPHCGHKLK